LNFGCFALPAIRPADYDELMMQRKHFAKLWQARHTQVRSLIERSEIKDPGCRFAPPR
jgi:hypothetical protein